MYSYVNDHVVQINFAIYNIYFQSETQNGKLSTYGSKFAGSG